MVKTKKIETQNAKSKETKEQLIARLMAKGPGDEGRCCGRCHY
jgi:hypothetical protein